MRKFFIALAFAPLFLFTSNAFAEIYRWVDEDGNIHYSDCPPVDCEFEEQAEPISGSKNHHDTQSRQGLHEMLL